MKQLDIYKFDGSKAEDNYKVSDNVLETLPNDHSIYLSVKAYLANQRQGTSKTKERNEVRGGGKKPWRQKGRGGARAGTSRSPLWVGGGNIFGPEPRDYRQDLNKKEKLLARKSAWVYKLQNDQVILVDKYLLEETKTKNMFAFLTNLKLENKKTLIITGAHDEKIYRASRNIPNVFVSDASLLSTYDLLNNKYVVVEKDTFEKLINNLFS